MQAPTAPPRGLYAPCTRFQKDVPYLTGLPFYWPQMQRNGLPRFQYTLRELAGGAQSSRPAAMHCSKTDSPLGVERCLHDPQRPGMDPHPVIIPTDLRTEFAGDTMHDQAASSPRASAPTVGAEPCFNPPAGPSANAGGESVPHPIGTEFFAAQVFASIRDFIAKAAACQLRHPTARKHSSRGDESPADRLARKAPHLSPGSSCFTPSP